MTPPRTVPPDPQRFLSWAAKDSISDSGRGSPVTVVTPLPALPLTSRPDPHRPELGRARSALGTHALAHGPAAIGTETADSRSSR